jgi:hypothetical protein
MTDAPLIQQIYDRLAHKRFSLEDEKETQRQIALALEEAPAFMFQREVPVTGGIIDFVVLPLPGRLHEQRDVGIEVKLKGGAGAIARQLGRYAQDPGLAGLVFVTSRPVMLGNSLHGKPLAVVHMGKGWL